MAVNIVLTAVLRANINQFLNGMREAGTGLQGVSEAINTAFDGIAIIAIIDLLKKLAEALAGIINDLLETAGKWEQMTFGMAAVLASSEKITDTTGKTLDITEKYNRAILLSGDLMKKLRLDAALNLGTTEELAGAFVGLSNSVSNTSKQGANAIERTRALANAIVVSSKVLGPMVLKGGMNQAIRETNELLQGRLTVINTFARTLGITTSEGKKAYKEALKNGTVYDFLMDKLKNYTAAQGFLSRSFVGLSDTIKDLFEMVKQSIAVFGFERFLGFLRSVVDMMVIRLPDGTAKLSEGFQAFMDELSPLFDELMIPLIGLMKELLAIILDNKETIISILRGAIQFLGLILNTITFILTVTRIGIKLLLSSLNVIISYIKTVYGLINGVLTLLTKVYDFIHAKIMPILNNLFDFLNVKFQSMFQWMLSKLGLSTDLQEEDNKKKKQAALLAKTHAEAIGSLNNELTKNNKNVKDNTQHWKNWIATLRSAYSNRFPSAAKSFLTMFGSGGTLSPTRSSAGAVPVNINLNGPNGNMTIPAKMTPQQLAQAHTSGRQFSGSLAKMQKGVVINPSTRSGPIFQN